MCIGPVKSYKAHVFAMTRVPEGSSLDGAKNSFAFSSFCLLRLKNTQPASRLSHGGATINTGSLTSVFIAAEHNGGEW